MDINDFFNPGDIREFCRSPFIYGDKTIATQGYVLLVAPKDDQYKTLESSPIAMLPELLVDLKKQDFKQIPLISLPDEFECVTCGGCGRATIDNCIECDGEGEVELSNSFNNYSAECQSCDGQGRDTFAGGKETCPTCKGRGQVFKDRSPVFVEGVHVDANYLKNILGEPDLLISVCVERSMLFFKSGVYEGVLMGMKV